MGTTSPSRAPTRPAHAACACWTTTSRFRVSTAGRRGKSRSTPTTSLAIVGRRMIGNGRGSQRRADPTCFCRIGPTEEAAATTPGRSRGDGCKGRLRRLSMQMSTTARRSDILFNMVLSSDHGCLDDLTSFRRHDFFDSATYFQHIFTSAILSDGLALELGRRIGTVLVHLIGWTAYGQMVGVRAQTSKPTLRSCIDGLAP